jgi:hypothetical protein
MLSLLPSVLYHHRCVLLQAFSGVFDVTFDHFWGFDSFQVLIYRTECCHDSHRCNHHRSLALLACLAGFIGVVCIYPSICDMAFLASLVLLAFASALKALTFHRAYVSGSASSG